MTIHEILAAVEVVSLAVVMLLVVGACFLDRWADRRHRTQVMEFLARQRSQDAIDYANQAVADATAAGRMPPAKPQTQTGQRSPGVRALENLADLDGLQDAADSIGGGS